MPSPLESLPNIVLAVGGLGMAAYALVDASKALPGGGPSSIGFDSIHDLVHGLLPTSGDAAVSKTAFSIVVGTLRSNWINGMAMSDQKAVARSMIKLYMQPTSAVPVALRLGLSDVDVRAVAGLWRNGPSKDPNVDPSAATVGRVDLALTAILDGMYQHADQRYRNVCKLLAGVVSVVISIAAGTAMPGSGGAANVFLYFVIGLLAVPLAPVAKDLASALQAGVKVAQSLRK